jgi:hypothetical protein
MVLNVSPPPPPSVTVTRVVVNLPDVLVVIVASPAATPVTPPEASTVAIRESEEAKVNPVAQLSGEHMTAVEPSL